MGTFKTGETLNFASGSITINGGSTISLTGLWEEREERIVLRDLRWWGVMISENNRIKSYEVFLIESRSEIFMNDRDKYY